VYLDSTLETQTKAILDMVFNLVVPLSFFRLVFFPFPFLSLVSYPIIRDLTTVVEMLLIDSPSLFSFFFSQMWRGHGGRLNVTQEAVPSLPPPLFPIVKKFKGLRDDSASLPSSFFLLCRRPENLGKKKAFGGFLFLSFSSLNLLR